MTICSLCNIKEGRGHENTKDHLQRLAYTSLNFPYKCHLCKRGFENSQGFSSHKNSGTHIKNESIRQGPPPSLLLKDKDLEAFKEAYPKYTPDETFKDAYNKYIISQEEYQNPDIREYLDIYEDEIIKILNSEVEVAPRKYKIQITSKYETERGDILYLNCSSYYKPIFNKIREIQDDVKESLEEEFERVSEEGESGKVFIGFVKLVLHTNKIKGFAGNCYVAMPFESKYVVNVQNEDTECFRYAVLCSVFYDKLKNNKNRVKTYEPYLNSLDFDSVEFPMKIENISSFERKNKLKINVFSMDKKWIL